MMKYLLFPDQHMCAFRTILMNCLANCFSGTKRKRTGYHACLDSAQQLVESNIQAITELTKKEIHIFSYFYDRAVDSSLIGEYMFLKYLFGEY